MYGGSGVLPNLLDERVPIPLEQELHDALAVFLDREHLGRGASGAEREPVSLSKFSRRPREDPPPTGIELLQKEKLGPPSSASHSLESGRKDSGFVQHQEIPGHEECRQVAEDAVTDGSVGSEMQEARAIPLGGRRLRDELGRKLVVEVG